MNIKSSNKGECTKEKLIELFNASAVKYHAAFPNKLKNFVIFSTEGPIYSTPENAAFLTRNAKKIQKLIDKSLKRIKEKECTGMASTKHNQSQKIIFNLITLNIDRVSKKYAPSTAPKEMNYLGTLDHEVGHLVVTSPQIPQDKGPMHIRECAADAFAALRHIQRFGDATHIFRQAPGATSRSIVLRSPIHYTAAIFQKIEKLRKEIDITSLSLKETAALAAKIAIQYSLPEKTIHRIHKAYKPVHGKHKEKNVTQEEILRTVINIMLKNKKDPEIYRAGRYFISRNFYRNTLNAVRKKDPSIQKAINLMKRHEKETGFILNAAEAIDAARQKKPTKTIIKEKPSISL